LYEESENVDDDSHTREAAGEEEELMSKIISMKAQLSMLEREMKSCEQF
jgi:hypothetical protein